MCSSDLISRSVTSHPSKKIQQVVVPKKYVQQKKILQTRRIPALKFLISPLPNLPFELGYLHVLSSMPTITVISNGMKQITSD